MEELLKELLEEQKKTNELLQVIVSNQEQKMKIDARKIAKEIGELNRRQLIKSGVIF